MKSNQKGSVIVFVVVIIGLIGLLYTSLYVIVGTERKIYYSLANRTKAYYIAESGIERAMALLKQGISDSFAYDNPFASHYKDFHRYDVVTESIGPNTYKITSTGIYKNTKRKIEVEVVKSEGNLIIQSWKEIN